MATTNMYGGGDAAITGLSPKDVSETLDAHYLSRNFGLAETGMRKHEAATEFEVACAEVRHHARFDSL